MNWMENGSARGRSAGTEAPARGRRNGGGCRWRKHAAEQGGRKDAEEHGQGHEDGPQYEREHDRETTEHESDSQGGSAERPDRFHWREYSAQKDR